MKYIINALKITGIVIVYFAIHTIVKVTTIDNEREVSSKTKSIPSTWGFGVKPGQNITTLQTYKREGTKMLALIPPIPGKHTYYFVLTTPTEKVSSVVGFLDLPSWNKCLNEYKGTISNLSTIYGDPIINNTSKYKSIFKVNIGNYGEIMVACQPLNHNTYKARLVTGYLSSPKLLKESEKNYSNELKRAINRIDNNNSLFKTPPHPF